MNTNHRKLQYVWKINRKINQKIDETVKRNMENMGGWTVTLPLMD